MAKKPSAYSIRLTSLRAPYTRAKVRFESTRKPVEFAHDELSTEQLLRLQADPAIKIELFDPKTGEAADIGVETLLPATEGAADPVEDGAAPETPPVVDPKEGDAQP